MENNTKKCSLEEHKESNAIIFCKECKIYMCNKCFSHHSNLFKIHHTYNLDKDEAKDIFIGLCQEQDHLIKLEYFCKNHNKLCCSSCIAKIKRNGNCQHSDCEVCTIEDISEEKKNKLLENIKILEDLSVNIDQLINQLKKIYEKIDEEKNELKIKIQNIFTNIRNALNEREDQLLIDIEKKFENKYFNNNILKESEKLPKRIKSSLEKGKIISKDWNKDNLNTLINDCINIENNTNSINIIKEIIKKCDNNNSKILIEKEEEGITKLLEFIKNFCNIYQVSPQTTNTFSKIQKILPIQTNQIQEKLVVISPKTVVAKNNLFGNPTKPISTTIKSSTGNLFG